MTGPRFPTRLEAVAFGLFCVPFLAFGFALAPGLKRAILGRDTPPGDPPGCGDHCGCSADPAACQMPCSACCVPMPCKQLPPPPTRAQ